MKDVAVRIATLEDRILKLAEVKSVRQSCTDHLGRTTEWHEPDFKQWVIIDVQGEWDSLGWNLDEAIELGSARDADLYGWSFVGRIKKFHRVPAVVPTVRLYIEIQAEA